VIVKPMIGSWEVPSIEHIGTLESRRTARLAVPGLAGDLQHDLGSDSLVVEISGSLAGDSARDDFLKSLREPFAAGAPVTFVADIVTATKLDKVIIESLEVQEHNDYASSFTYHVVLRQYVEPPPPATAIDDLGSDLQSDLADAAKLGLDGLDLAGLLGAIPDIGNPEPPLQTALGGVKSALGGLLQPLGKLTGALTGAS
jgi:hypothetical protein